MRPAKDDFEEKMMTYLAHSKNKSEIVHALQEHLSSVAVLAKKFAGQAVWREEADLTASIHDLGKYADAFQARLRGEVHGLDHWSPGAWVALKEYHAVAAALAIQGHHIGLQQGNHSALRNLDPATLAERHPLKLKLSEADFNLLISRLSNDGLSISKPADRIIDPHKGFYNPVAKMADVRMLYSCLTDADFLDTEAHFEGNDNGKKYREQGPALNALSAIRALNEFVSKNVRSTSEADPIVREARDALWSMTLASALGTPGVYTLTAPTGSGKTLAMLNFALHHAEKNKLKRIILVVPFLSIIEQTAAIYRKIFASFADNYVLEHHSLAGLGIESTVDDGAVNEVERARRLLAENWDAPIIITTNVQLLESLFSNRPSTCRKLHNLMDSVIMFDEAQSLPLNLAIPTLAALSHLSQSYKATVLFATATQPAFDTLDKTVKNYAPGGWSPVEVAQDHKRLYDILRRYDVKWPKPAEINDWQSIADEICNDSQVLCVVNLKSHATALLDKMNGLDGVFHLSTNLCALHRRNVLDTVRERLDKSNPQTCRLVSTQCIEAGVDVDFPVVYRALAPLDAIAQAAGRCNREGRLVDADGSQKKGLVHVFDPAIEGTWRGRYPTFTYYQAAETVRTMLIEKGDQGLDLNDPTVFRDYYRRLYDLNKPEAQSTELNEAFHSIDFVRVAQEYRLIEKAAIQVLVPYQPHKDLFDELLYAQDKEGITPKWMRRAQGLMVSIFRPRADHPAWEVLIPVKLRHAKGFSDECFFLEDRNGDFYDDVLGLILPQSQQIFIA